MSKIEMEIWGRKLDIEIVYDVYEGESVIESQKTTYDSFVKSSTQLFNIALDEVKNYCLSLNKDDIPETEITNIFKYVKPKAIYVKRDTGEDRIVALMCAYKFNPDDGLAVVFKNESFDKIGTENIII